MKKKVLLIIVCTILTFTGFLLLLLQVRQKAFIKTWNFNNELLNEPSSYPDKLEHNHLLKPFDSAFDINMILNERPIYTNKKNETYRYRQNGRPEKVASVAGVISPNQKQIAYTTKKKDNWGIEPYIYLYDITNNRNSTKINLFDDSISKYVHSWSPDNKYILLLNEAQATGTVKAKPYNFSTRTFYREVDLYNTFILWASSSSFYYFSEELDCLSLPCKHLGLTLNKYNLNSGEFKEIGKVHQGDELYPIVTNMYLIKNKVQISLSNYEVIPSDSIQTNRKEIKSYKEFSLLEEKLREITEENSIEENTLLRIKELEKESYRIKFESDFSNNFHLIKLVPKIEGLEEKFLIVKLADQDIESYKFLDL